MLFRFHNSLFSLQNFPLHLSSNHFFQLSYSSNHSTLFQETRYQLLVLRPSQKVSWIGYAMTHHLTGDYEMALNVLEEFRKTQTVVGFSFHYDCDSLLLLLLFFYIVVCCYCFFFFCKQKQCYSVLQSFSHFNVIFAFSLRYCFFNMLAQSFLIIIPQLLNVPNLPKCSQSTHKLPITHTSNSFSFHVHLNHLQIFPQSSPPY